MNSSKQILYTLSSFVVFFLIAYFVIQRKKEASASRNQTNIRMQSGNCDLDKFRLDDLKIKIGSRSFSPIIKTDSLSIYFKEEIVPMRFEDSSFRYFEENQQNFTFFTGGLESKIKSIQIESANGLSCSIGDSLLFIDIYSLDDFLLKFPKSHACRNTRRKGRYSSNCILRIKNSDPSGRLQYLQISFNNIGNMNWIEFYY